MTKQIINGKKRDKNTLWLSWVSYFNDISSEMLTPILPIFFTETLGLSKGVVGIIEGIAESFSSLLRTFSGYVSDKLKKRKIFIMLGYGIPAFIKPVYIFASVWWHVFLIRFIERTGKGLREPPRDALIAGSTSVRHYGRAFGFQRMMDTMGAVTGVILLTVLLHYIHSDYYILFLIAFIPGIIALTLSITKVKEDKKIETTKRTINFKAVLKLPRRFKFFLLPTFIFAIGNMSYAFFILRVQDIGLPIEFLPMVYLIYTVIYAAISIPAGQLSDKIGKVITLIFGNLFFLGACLLLMFKIPVEFTVIVFVLYGLFFAFNVGISKAYISSVVPLEYNATAHGIYHFIIGICAFPASFMVGFLWDAYGVMIAFGYSAILTVISTVLYFFLIPKQRISHPAETAKASAN